MPMRALLIDLDGVIYDGGQPVDGASDVVAWLDRERVPRLFLTNTTSRPRSALVERLDAMGIAVPETDILTPPVAATRWLRDNVRGAVALFVPPATVGEFDGIDDEGSTGNGSVGAVVVGDYAEGWDYDELNRAFRLLMRDPQPVLVALGMTRYWHAPDGLRLDTAPFVQALSHASGIEPVVLGKPAAPFFEAALELLNARPGETIMIGDDIRTDVDAAQRLGIAGALVRTGKFREADMTLGIAPDVVFDSIAGLPDWWQRR